MANNRDKVRFDDLENLKHDSLGVSSNLSEKIAMVNKRLLEYEVRMTYVENHCFNKQEPVINMVNKRFHNLETEIKRRIETIE